MRNELLSCCQVCGLKYEDFYPWGEKGDTPSFEVCPCCCCEYGFDDDTDASGYNAEKYREKWLNEGAIFDNPKSKYYPQNWNLEVLKKQLLNIGVVLDRKIIIKTKKSGKLPPFIIRKFI